PQYTPPDSDNEEDGYDKMVGVSSGVNDATINALGWKADKPLDFTIKDNSKHITESLRWFTDVPVSINIKDKDGKSVTATGNFTRINNGEPEPMLCLGMTWIRKVQVYILGSEDGRQATEKGYNGTTNYRSQQ
ncbi:8096_t:CDS:2, partial [Rhizophagus irregularis]